jgi:hypothetical protein
MAKRIFRVEHVRNQATPLKVKDCRKRCRMRLRMLLAAVALPLLHPTNDRALECVAADCFSNCGNLSCCVSGFDGEPTPWRMTRYGWQDSSTWMLPATVPYERRIELIHPVSFATLVLLSAMGAVIWASEEKEWQRAIS